MATSSKTGRSWNNNNNKLILVSIKLTLDNWIFIFPLGKELQYVWKYFKLFSTSPYYVKMSFFMSVQNMLQPPKSLFPYFIVNSCHIHLVAKINVPLFYYILFRINRYKMPRYRKKFRLMNFWWIIELEARCISHLFKFSTCRMYGGIGAVFPFSLYEF